METVATVIAFVQAAGAIVKCIVKTKQLWDQFKDVPEEIQDLVDRLQLYEATFRNIEAQLQSQDIPPRLWDTQPALSSLEFCIKAHQKLERLVSELNNQIVKKNGVKKKFAVFKTSGKRGLIPRLEKMLDSSVGLLNLSVQQYQMVFFLNSHEVISQRVVTDLMPYLSRPVVAEQRTIQCCKIEQPKEESGEDSVSLQRTEPSQVATYSAPSKWGRFALSYTSSTGSWLAYLQLPSWASKSIYEFYSGPTLSGWKYNYRVYNIVSHESQIMIKVHQGDRQGVLELFRTRQASPFDRDDEGNSLLYHAAKKKHYDICELFLHMGLQEVLKDVVGTNRESPLTPLVYGTRDQKSVYDWERLAVLFRSYLHEPPCTLIERLFDFLQEWVYDDEFITVFQEKFIPNFYTGPLRYRLQAIRLGCFHAKSPDTLLSLLDKNKLVTDSAVSMSTHEKLSLVHSAAISVGIRYADELRPRRRGQFQWHVYNEAWGMVASQIASVSDARDLSTIETVRPWDVYSVPIWRGTPLISVLGGALCYISPDLSIFHWDMYFQETLRLWVATLQEASVDLVGYGKQEMLGLTGELNGAFDADAIRASRNQIRDVMPRQAWSLRIQEQDHDRGLWNENHWIPVRIVGLQIGANPDDWRLLWAPEFEHMALEFWALIERGNEVMPGSWVD